MGNWTIIIQGTGAHHNGDAEVDADAVAVMAVEQLRKQGQTVEVASFVSGGKTDLLTLPNIFEVVVNGRHERLCSPQSYDSLKGVAGFKTYSHPTITFSRHAHRGDGILNADEMVTLNNGMIFNIANTGGA